MQSRGEHGVTNNHLRQVRRRFHSSNDVSPKTGSRQEAFIPLMWSPPQASVPLGRDFCFPALRHLTGTVGAEYSGAGDRVAFRWIGDTYRLADAGDRLDYRPVRSVRRMGRPGEGLGGTQKRVQGGYQLHHRYLEPVGLRARPVATTRLDTRHRRQNLRDSGHLPRHPLLASGGIVTDPTLAMVGEGGQDEVVIPLPDRWQDSTLSVFQIEDNETPEEKKQRIAQALAENKKLFEEQGWNWERTPEEQAEVDALFKHLGIRSWNGEPESG